MKKFSIVVLITVICCMCWTFSITAVESDLKWGKSLQSKVNQALDMSSGDPVYSLLVFKDLLEQEKNSPTESQKIWLKEQIDHLRPKALHMLQQHYDTAAEVLNLRDMFIASTVAKKISEEGIQIEPSMSTVKTKVFAGAQEAKHIWRITNISAKLLEGAYTEVVFDKRYSVSPKGDSQLLRVKADVENISSEQDKSYTLWTMDIVKRSVAPLFTQYENIQVPYIWLDQSLIYLLTSDLNMISCIQVYEGSGLRKGGTIAVQDRVIISPQPIKEGTTIDIDVIFSIPKEPREYQLFIFGAAPVNIPKIGK